MRISTARTQSDVRSAMTSTRRSLVASFAAASVVAGLFVAAPLAEASTSATAQTGLAATVNPVAAGTSTVTSVGRLAPAGCTRAATVTCELWARTGSTTMPGALSAIPIWGFAPDATTPVTAPGPVLVVNQDDKVTILVHNTLSQQVSLALPGQTSINGGGGDDRTGVGSNGVASYTFTASRPGTFLYEAGHTPDGARQVAMGMAGALVVLPTSPGTAYGTVAGYPATAYDDDALLVLSEIDPALNTSADPLTFDMRSFRPSFRLINGHPFPSATSSIATDQGHKVLVRYVNVGQVTHPMSVLGGTQDEVAQDGHPMHYASTVAAESVEPGSTLDTLITMPSSTGDSRYATKVGIYEANGSLDNAGSQTADTPPQVGFGGMLTFLDTNVPVDTANDFVGPTSKSLTISPNPSNALNDVTVTAAVSDANTGGKLVTAAEYVIDDNAAAPIAASSGSPMTLAASAVSTTATGTIPASVLANPTFAAGKHIVYVRAKDALGNWGAVGSIVLNVPKQGPATTGGTLSPSITNGTVPIDISATGDDSLAGGKVTTAEYFVDTAPLPAAYGTGIAMTTNRTATVVSVDATFDPTAPGAPVLTEGLHHIWVHVKDDLGSAGLWGPVLDIPLTIDKTPPKNLAVSVSPAATNGVLSDPSNPGYLLITADIQDPGAESPDNLIQAEAFINTIKTSGSGLQLIPIDGVLNKPQEKFYALIPLSQIKAYKDGSITLYVHALDGAGNWGDATLSPTTILVDRVAPKLLGLTGSIGPVGQPGVALTSTLTELNSLGSAEVWTGTKDPGVGKATPAQFSVAAGKVTVQAAFPATAGKIVYNTRVRDMAGNWSNVVTTTVSVFRSYLQAVGDWNKQTGVATIAPTAALQGPDEPGSTAGLKVTLATTPAASSLGYLTDNSPVANSTYHARFRFQAPSLNSGGNANNVLTIFDTRTANGANGGTEVFGLQYHGTGAAAQIRAVIGTTLGNWITVGTAVHSITVDWANGPAATLTLGIDSTTSTVTANAVGTIESAQLGVSAAAFNSNSTGATGTAYFDSFFSVAGN